MGHSIWHAVGISPASGFERDNDIYARKMGGALKHDDEFSSSAAQRKELDGSDENAADKVSLAVR
jgi:hypothetical protein